MRYGTLSHDSVCDINPLKFKTGQKEMKPFFAMFATLTGSTKCEIMTGRPCESLFCFIITHQSDISFVPTLC